MTFLYSLRLGRWGIASFSLFAFVLTLGQAAGFYQLAGNTPAERAAFGRSMTQLAAQLTVLLPPPFRPDTVGGYLQFRAYGALAIVFAIWALVSAAGAARGDEERGRVEMVLSTGTSRADVVVGRFAAFAAGSFAAAAAAGLGVAVAVDGAHETLSAASVLGATVVLAGLALCCYSITLVIAQLAAARLATAISGAVLLALFLVNSLGRNLDWLQHWQWISPFHYYELSRTLQPGGSVDVRATEILFSIAVTGAVAAALAFSFRDLGAPLVRPPAVARSFTTHKVGFALPWLAPVLRGVYERRVGLLVWTLGVAALAMTMVALTKSIAQPILSVPGLATYFNSFIQGGIYPALLGFTWFGIAQLLMAGYAIMQVARWSAEDTDGRLELMLSNPVPRRFVVVERFAVLLVCTLIIVGVSGWAVAFESRQQSIDLNTAMLVAATLLLVPFTFFFAAIGSVLATRWPRATVGVLAAVALAGYFLTQLGPIFKWPSWTQDLSAFHLYGTPMSSGVDGFGLAVMFAVIAMGFIGSMLLIERRDIGA